MKTYLNVSYAEKDIVKQMGARWDGVKKSWYVENVEDLSVFGKWFVVESISVIKYSEEILVESVVKSVDIVIYADGASKGNPGRGGWGVFMTHSEVVTELFGGATDVTNNQMELTAVIKALEVADKSLSVLIRTDSKYVIDGATKWVHGWKKNGWKASKGEVKNKELWQELDSWLVRHKSVVFEWVKGHSGDIGNDRADALANMGCAKF